MAVRGNGVGEVEKGTEVVNGRVVLPLEYALGGRGRERRA